MAQEEEEDGENTVSPPFLVPMQARKTGGGHHPTQFTL